MEEQSQTFASEQLNIRRFCHITYKNFELAKKLVAEAVGTYFMIFAGCGAVVVDNKSNGSITHLGISLVWGMAVMIIIYAIGHISGAHLNPGVTIAFAALRKFPWTHVPMYIATQMGASIAAAYTLKLLFGDVANMAATIPAGSNAQSFMLEFLITFFLMFVVCAVATDTRAVGELAGLAIGTTVAMNVIIAGPISGSSLNPARTLGSAVAGGEYKGFWLYMVAPPVGALLGAFTYEFIRLSPIQQPSQTDALERSKSIFKNNNESV